MAILDAHVREVKDWACLKQAMRWAADPVIEGAYWAGYAGVEDLNERRLRDAEVLGGVCANARGSLLLEIGTGHGVGTALMARNAPQAVIYTVNIPPEEIREGGVMTTGALTRDEIGRCYREQGCTRVKQIFANTRDWTPDFGPIDVAFVDGCHDTAFVINDTLKALASHRG